MSQLHGPLPSSAAAIVASNSARPAAIANIKPAERSFKNALASKRRDDEVSLSSVEIEDAVRPLADPSQEEAHQEHRQHEQQRPGNPASLDIKA